MNPYFLSGSICRQVRATGWWKLVKMGVWEWGFCGCRKIEGRTIECFHIHRYSVCIDICVYIYMDNPWKSSCSKKTKIYTIIQVSVYDLIWRSQSRFPQKYFCLKLLEHFKFIVHLSFITSLDMSGHFVCIQKNKVDGGWLEDHEIWKKLIIFSQPKKLLEARTMLETFPQKKTPRKPTSHLPGGRGPKRKLWNLPPQMFQLCLF